MKWIVTLSDGKEVETTGGSASDAASNVARWKLPEPVSAGQRAEVKVRRKNDPKQEEVIHLITHCYWSEDLKKKYGPSSTDNG